MNWIIFFDEKCALCRNSVERLLKWDHRHLFLFAPLEGKTAAKKLIGKHEYLKRENSLVLMENLKGNIQFWLRSRAVFRILWLLGGKWALLGWLSFLPFGFDRIYRFIAKHRHQIQLKESFLMQDERILP